MADRSSSGSAIALRRSPSYRAPGALPAKASGRTSVVWFFCAPSAQDEEVSAVEGPSGSHFLDACTFCRLPLRRDRDVYMCRGNVAFCSEECRQEWMDIEDKREDAERAHYRSVCADEVATPTTGSTTEEKKGMEAAANRASRVFHVRAAETVVAG